MSQLVRGLCTLVPTASRNPWERLPVTPAVAGIPNAKHISGLHPGCGISVRGCRSACWVLPGVSRFGGCQSSHGLVAPSTLPEKHETLARGGWTPAWSVSTVGAPWFIVLACEVLVMIAPMPAVKEFGVSHLFKRICAV